MQNPKTTWSGYIGLVGTLLLAIGAFGATTNWGKVLLGIGAVLKGADSVGNIASQDGGH